MKKFKNVFRQKTLTIFLYIKKHRAESTVFFYDYLKVRRLFFVIKTGYGIGSIFGFSTAKKRTISIELGMQNAGMATVLATSFFAKPEILSHNPEAILCVVPCAISCAYHSISGTILASLFVKMDQK